MGSLKVEIGKRWVVRLVARVKSDSVILLAAFERAGFTRVADGGVITLVRARGERA